MNQIVCKLNEEDNFSIDNPQFEVDLTDKKDYHSTFYRYYRRLYQFPSFFSNEALDLFYISLMVYYADRKVLRRETSDAWTRELKLYIPVLELDKWIANKVLLEKMVSFLSGDLWQFEFRKRELNAKEIKVSKGVSRSRKEYSPDAFCMLSGGLDSFIGAIDLLNLSKNIAFVGHYGGGKGVIEYQNNVKSKLVEKYSLEERQFFNFYAAPIKGIEDSTRTRSFMFFAHAIILASAVNKPINLYIPENGLISLNIPLTNTRLGSSSTRTTHPYYMQLLQELLNNLDIKINLRNPFQFFTKGEMILNCKDSSFLEQNIANTMSCSHPDLGRYQKENAPSHCGTCLPCVIRRASIEKAYGVDNSIYRDRDFKIGKATSELNSYKIGILDFKHSTSNVSFKIQEAGPISSNLEEYSGLYKRGMDELATLLDKYNG
ncbi:MAG: 7-cyano-7-deazaguanine synthase [Candidatus Peribacteraceae bacterium]|nr:7-cyano-7-deazaguanine synthase [Candidatus Peribacteraceae bacterium]